MYIQSAWSAVFLAMKTGYVFLIPNNWIYNCILIRMIYQQDLYIIEEKPKEELAKGLLSELGTFSTTYPISAAEMSKDFNLPIGKQTCI
jgi:type IV secretory pathway VirB3-like protein